MQTLQRCGESFQFAFENCISLFCIHEISTFRCFYPWNIYGKMRWWYPILWIHISNNNMSAAANNFELKREIQSFHFNRELVAKSIFHRIKTNILTRFRKISPPPPSSRGAKTWSEMTLHDGLNCILNTKKIQVEKCPIQKCF